MIRRVAALLPLSVLLVAASLAPTVRADDGFKALFDGKSLKGWEGRKDIWSVQDGAITGQTTSETKLRKNTFLIWRDGELEDFELRLKFRLKSDKGNSGIQYRSVQVIGKAAKAEDFVVKGYQADIDATFRFIGILYEERGRGILAQRTTKVEIDAQGKKHVVGKTADNKKFLASVKKGDWNEYTITARGNHLVQKINGITTVDVTDNQESRAAKKGILAFQVHVGPPMIIQFKDIRLKKLK